MKIYDKDYEGQPTWQVFGRELNYYDGSRYAIYLKKFLMDGGKVCLEITEGARKGTIAQIELDPETIETDFKERTSHYSGRHYTYVPETMKLSVEGRSWTVERTFRKSFPGILRFNSEPVFVYTANKKTPEQKAAEAVIPVIKDHFGYELSVGSLVIFPMGKKGEVDTRFGFITDISHKGTIKIRAIRTRKNHQDIEVTLSPLFGGIDLILLEGDIKNKVMTAKLGLN